MQSSDLKKDYIWNTLGSLCYALASMVMAFAALRYAGPDDGGIFGFGYSTLGQQMFIIAYFGIRPFHITDTRRVYSYEDYRKLRTLTAVLSVFSAAVFLTAMFSLGRYSARKVAILMMLALMKILDGVADLYESECQRIGKLYIAGMELMCRTLLFSAVLIGLLVLCGDILFAVWSALLAQFVFVVAAGYSFRKHLFVPFESGTGAVRNAPGSTHAVRKLFLDTFLIFLSVFLDFYIFSASKYAVDLYMTDEANGIFNILFMPTSIIYLFANFIMRPALSRLSIARDEGRAGDFRKGILGLLKLILAISGAGLLVTLVLGRTALSIGEYALGAGFSGALTGESLSFFLIILGGCLYCIADLYYYVLIILRKQKVIFAIYIVMTVVAFGVSHITVSLLGLSGAAIAYVLYMILMSAAFMLSAESLIGSVGDGGEKR